MYILRLINFTLIISIVLICIWLSTILCYFISCPCTVILYVFRWSLWCCRVGRNRRHDETLYHVVQNCWSTSTIAHSEDAVKQLPARRAVDIFLVWLGPLPGWRVGPTWDLPWLTGLSHPLHVPCVHRSMWDHAICRVDIPSAKTALPSFFMRRLARALHVDGDGPTRSHVPAAVSSSMCLSWVFMVIQRIYRLHVLQKSLPKSRKI